MVVVLVDHFPPESGWKVEVTSQIVSKFPERDCNGCYECSLSEDTQRQQLFGSFVWFQLVYSLSPVDSSSLMGSHSWISYPWFRWGCGVRRSVDSVTCNGWWKRKYDIAVMRLFLYLCSRFCFAGDLTSWYKRSFRPVKTGSVRSFRVIPIEFSYHFQGVRSGFGS